MFDSLMKNADPLIASLLDRVLDKKRLKEEDYITLMNVKGFELLLLQITADLIRKREVGDYVSFVVNRNINFTNICVGKCSFCAFRRSPDKQEAYFLSIDEILQRVRDSIRKEITEICIQGGLHPDIDITYYETMIKRIKQEFPDIHIHAFSPMELYYISKKSDLSIMEVLKTLKEAGLDSIPGTAAEILHDEIRRVICPKKINTEEWVNVIKSAHRIGIPTTCTMMYGHIEGPEEKIRHLLLLKEIQKETKGFTEFVPLSFIHQNTELYKSNKARPGATGAEDLKVICLSRIIFEGYIKNIQASWVKLGQKLAQLMLNAGANDLGGTLFEENISRTAGARHGEYLEKEEMIRLIKDIGRVPVERSTVYEKLKVYL
ncbi:MAG: 5-amino-6-(D-ribitylamino)uracil--L-tyrosine 4-hydroxyphenyl transferase CofH [Candidatus Hydrothermarchaeota archaeon]